MHYHRKAPASWSGVGGIWVYDGRQVANASSGVVDGISVRRRTQSLTGTCERCNDPTLTSVGHNGPKYPRWIVLLLFTIHMLGICGHSFALDPVSFTNFSGVNESESDNVLFANAVSWNRMDFDWAKYEPAPGKYNNQYLDDYGRLVLSLRAKGIQLLPMLGYNTTWSSIDGHDKSPLASEHVADWMRMVDRVVKYLKAAPFNVRYFQIWNEAHPLSGFWDGDLDTYMRRVHLPAAKVIRSNGAKVVYGGWPLVGNLTEYVSLLDRHNAWTTLDVLDIHYSADTEGFQMLYDAARVRGYSNIAIWQTEFGFESDGAFAADTYPRILYWALNHNWNDQNKYRLFWFPNSAPDDPDAYGYQTGLYNGSSLSPVGTSLRTMGSLFARSNLKPYSVTLSRGEGEGFLMDGQILVALHIKPTSATTVQITLPKPLGRVGKIERVDLTGRRRDLTTNVRQTASNVIINAPIAEDRNSPAFSWNRNMEHSTPTFFVAIQLEG